MTLIAFLLFELLIIVIVARSCFDAGLRRGMDAAHERLLEEDAAVERHPLGEWPGMPVFAPRLVNGEWLICRVAGRGLTFGGRYQVYDASQRGWVKLVGSPKRYEDWRFERGPL